MQLRDFLKETKTSTAQMAEKVGAANPSVVWRHATGIRHPTPEFVERYEKATLGAVTAQDWQDLAINKDAEESAA